MSRDLRFIVPAGPVRIGPSVHRVMPAGRWGGLPVRTSEDAPPVPMSQLDRIGYHAATVLGGGMLGDTTAYVPSTSRLLTAWQCHMLYVRVPDVRSSIDSVVRRVATTEWDVVPLIDPREPEYEDALAECAAQVLWLETPTADGKTFQEIWTATLTDLLKWDAGVIERVWGPGAEGAETIVEAVPMRGADVHPRVNEVGRLLDYVQTPTIALQGAARAIAIPASKILYMAMFPNTDGPEGLPLLESLVYETIGLLRAAEFEASSLNLNEIPPGLLVVAGIADQAADRMRSDFESKATQEWRIRLLSSSRAGVVDAKWVRFSKDPKELQVLDVGKWFSHTVWRIFGVTPIEQGESDANPRATAQVQLDASQSHLITPILSLTESRINADLVQPRLPERWRGLIAFRWKRERVLTPAERKAISDEFGSYVDRGVMTRNEVRHELHLPPLERGDEATVTVAGSVKTLADALEPPAPAPGPFAPGGGSSGGDGSPGDGTTSGDTVDDGQTAQQEDDAAQAASRPRLRVLGGRGALALVARRRALEPPRDGRVGLRPSARSSSDDLPSDWQPAGRFRGVRTLDLAGLWDEVAGYARDVRPLWEEARTEAMSATMSEYVESGFDSDRRQRLADRIAREVERLRERWALAVAPRYERVALSARARASSWTTYASEVEVVRSRAATYRSTALNYLDQPGGLLSDLRSRLGQVLVAVSDTRNRPDRRVDERASDLTPDATAAAVVLAVASVFDGQRHRIDNWSGKLVDLAYDVLASEVQAGASTGAAGGIADPDPGEGAVEWMAEWVVVGDEASCETCLDFGSRGFVPLSSLPTRPGGNTRCRSRCRCCLVIWTSAEVASGRAKLYGGGNTGKPL